MNKFNYNIGLDIGTTSVGWAVVNDDTSKVVRKGNKRLWGVRLFEEAETAAERRSFRSIRRRYDRRRKRIKLLQDFFKDEVLKADKNFFVKMKESFYNSNDLINKTVAISDDELNLIKRYYKKYPTIYHLRKHLMECDCIEDIRLVYLAIHHIIKYRGNFIYTGGNFDINSLNIEECLEEIFDLFNLLCDEVSFNVDYISDIDYKKLEDSILFHSKNDKKVLLKNALQLYVSKDFLTQFTNLVIGNQFSVSKLFNIDLDDDIKIKFQGSKYDDERDLIEKVIGSKIEILDVCKNLYDMIFLKEMFKGKSSCSLSVEMVDRYDVHKDDLSYLKQLFRYDGVLYKKMFKSKRDKKKDILCIYDSYIHNKLTYDDFRKELNKNLEVLFDKVTNQELIDKYNLSIKTRIDNGSFLPRITDVDNGKFPFQLNRAELVKIIEKQGKFYPFLLEKVNDSEYKLERLLSFKIPYYVGPLNTTTSSEKLNSNAWLVKRKDVNRITPYNFDEIIDKEKTAEEFINRMISHCTYLLDKYVMPTNSIVYSKFKVMNELKQIKVNDLRLPLDVQKSIIEELFMKREGTITDKIFKEYIRKKNLFPMFNDDLMVVGYSSDKGFANNMSVYVDFFGNDGVFKDTNYNIKNAEEIIRWITIFEDKSILESKLRDNYVDLSDAKIKSLLIKKYKGWSRLSEELLTTKYYVNKETGIKMSIMDLLEETNENFMQIINNDKYKFQNMIDEYNNINEASIINYDLVSKLATSPSTKRGIYQALKVVSEIVEYMGYTPQNIMIEMARGDGIKKRTERRKDYLVNLYKKYKGEINDFSKLNNQLSRVEKIDSEKLFLYFIQEGKSLYSMEPINIDELFTDKYEVDHIIPRTLIKNDSIDNKGLVLREENQLKAANFVLPEVFRSEKNKKWWNHLKKIGLISSKKYNALCRYKYSDEDIKGFINRQLVETRQVTKHVANILKSFYKESNVVYLHADLSHNYRERFKLYKFRNLNDYHHAHDAYLAAVIGNFTSNYLKDVNFERLKVINRELIKNKQYGKLRFGYVINSMDNQLLINDSTGEVMFDVDSVNNIVQDTLYNNDILISKKVEFRTGQFYDQTIMKKGNPGIRLKDNLPTELYGSYNSLKASYVVLVKWIKKGKENQRLIGIPTYIDVKSKVKKGLLDSYVRNLLELGENDKVIIGNMKIPFNQLLDCNGKMCYLVGAGSTNPKVEICNAKQFIIDKVHMKMWKDSLNRLLNKKIYSQPDEMLYENQLTDIIRYIVEKIEKEYLLFSDNLNEMKKIFCIDNIDSLSLEKKETIIMETFTLLRCNSTAANYKLLGRSDRFGRKAQNNIDHAKLIFKSVTGIWEKESEF